VHYYDYSIKSEMELDVRTLVQREMSKQIGFGLLTQIAASIGGGVAQTVWANVGFPLLEANYYEVNSRY